MASNIELGPSTFSADDVKHIAEDCLSCLGFSLQSTTSSDKVVIQAERSDWLEQLLEDAFLSSFG